MTSFTDIRPRLRGRPTLTSTGLRRNGVGFGLPLAHRRLDDARCRPQAHVVLTRPGALRPVPIESSVYHKPRQPGGKQVALDWARPAGADMPALRERLLLEGATEAHLAQAGGRGREFIELRASICGFAAERRDEHSRRAEAYRFAVRALKSPVGKLFGRDHIGPGKKLIGQVPVQALAVGRLLALHFGQFVARGLVALGAVPGLLALFDRAVGVEVVRVVGPALAVELPLERALLGLAVPQFGAERHQDSGFLRHDGQVRRTDVQPGGAFAESVLLVGLSAADQLSVETDAAAELATHDPDELDGALQPVEAIILLSGTARSDVITLTGNVRKNFSPMEWARARERLLQNGLSLAEIARQTGLAHQRLSDWKQLLDLAPEVQAALEQGHISLQVALALGKAPLSFQPELARLALQTDLTEIKARQLAEWVHDSLAAEGPAVVEVTQLAAALGLVPAGVESMADSSASATDAPTPPLATLHAPAVTPHRKNAHGRTLAKAITGEAALHMLWAHFPALESHGLADQAAARGINEKTLLLAGLMVQEDRLEVDEAVEGVLTLPLTPEIRAQSNGLYTVAREYDLLEHGQWDETAERLLHIQWLVAKQVERVKQAAQARKKKLRATGRKDRKGKTA